MEPYATVKHLVQDPDGQACCEVNSNTMETSLPETIHSGSIDPYTQVHRESSNDSQNLDSGSQESQCDSVLSSSQKVEHLRKVPEVHLVETMNFQNPKFIDDYEGPVLIAITTDTPELNSGHGTFVLSRDRWAGLSERESMFGSAKPETYDNNNTVFLSPMPNATLNHLGYAVKSGQDSLILQDECNALSDDNSIPRRTTISPENSFIPSLVTVCDGCNSLTDSEKSLTKYVMSSLSAGSEGYDKVVFMTDNSKSSTVEVVPTGHSGCDHDSSYDTLKTVGKVSSPSSSGCNMETSLSGTVNNSFTSGSIDPYAQVHIDNSLGSQNNAYGPQLNNLYDNPDSYPRPLNHSTCTHPNTQVSSNVITPIVPLECFQNQTFMDDSEQICLTGITMHVLETNTNNCTSITSSTDSGFVISDQESVVTSHMPESDGYGKILCIPIKPNLAPLQHTGNVPYTLNCSQNEAEAQSDHNSVHSNTSTKCDEQTAIPDVLKTSVPSDAFDLLPHLLDNSDTESRPDSENDKCYMKSVQPGYTIL